jgi:hypothetical protein
MELYILPLNVQSVFVGSINISPSDRVGPWRRGSRPIVDIEAGAPFAYARRLLVAIRLSCAVGRW